MYNIFKIMSVILKIMTPAYAQMNFKQSSGTLSLVCLFKANPDQNVH